MCFGPCTTYAKCGHQKFEIRDECQAGPNSHGQCSKNVFTVTRHLWSQTPSLCVNCYRRHVDDVIARYKRQIAEKEQSIARLTQYLGKCTPAEHEAVKSAISRIEFDRGELIDGRYAELEEFRIQQGVWADG